MKKSDWKSRALQVNEAKTSDWRSRAIPSEIVPDEEGIDAYAKRAAMQIPLGYAAKFTYPADIASLAAQGATREALEESEAMQEARQLFPQDFPAPLSEQEKQKYIQGTAQMFPTQANVERFVEEKTGLPLQAKTKAQKLLRLGGEAASFRPGDLAQKAKAGVIAPVISGGLQVAGVPEEVANVAGLVGSNVSLKKTQETFPSGLQKPRAAESKLTKFASVPEELKARRIKELDKEAKQISQKILERERPLTKKIQEGYDFSKEFKEGFGQLNKAAEKFKTPLDNTPIQDFLYDKIAKLRRISAISPESKKILQKAKNLYRKPIMDLDNGLKSYREINDEISQITKNYTRYGSQPDYLNFLNELKSNIRESFKQTLPEDSPWLNSFLNLNQRYADFQNTQKAIAQAESVFGKNLKSDTLIKIATNPKNKDKLIRNFGKKGAEDILELTNNLAKAKSSITQISTKDVKSFSDALPNLKESAVASGLIYFLPGLGKTFALGAAAKAPINYGRFLLGKYLTNPTVKRNYIGALKAITEKKPEELAYYIKKLEESSQK